MNLLSPKKLNSYYLGQSKYLTTTTIEDIEIIVRLRKVLLFDKNEPMVEVGKADVRCRYGLLCWSRGL